MGTRRTTLSRVVLLACSASLLAGCGSGARTLRVVSTPPDLKTVDLPPRGKSPGDLYTFSSVLLDRTRRRPIGVLRGTQTSIRLEGGRELVQGILTFRLGRGNDILVGGLSEFPTSGTGLIVGRPYVRSILGGTGAYADARGTLTSTRRSDGSYEQLFRLRT